MTSFTQLKATSLSHLLRVVYRPLRRVLYFLKECENWGFGWSPRVGLGIFECWIWWAKLTREFIDQFFVAQAGICCLRGVQKRILAFALVTLSSIFRIWCRRACVSLGIIMFLDNVKKLWLDNCLVTENQCLYRSFYSWKELVLKVAMLYWMQRCLSREWSRKLGCHRGGVLWKGDLVRVLWMDGIGVVFQSPLPSCLKSGEKQGLEQWRNGACWDKC